jgi:Xaa-Pro dipeptidase
MIKAAGVVTASASLPAGIATARSARIPIPPPIGRDERLQRVLKARALMKQNGIGAIIVEPGSSLDYLTGVQWWRSERLTAAVIPVEGDPIIVTPFFEKPSVEESLKIPAEVRVWQEDEEPLKVVGDFLKERGVAGAPVGFEETNRYGYSTGSNSSCPMLRLSAPIQSCAHSGC